ncbi:hypothetical protein [Haliangium sp.]|uniref:hypothetical protein n=1 Tax=Haliangium sp. TaxID=2663208 RepID=UPI003D108040
MGWLALICAVAAVVVANLPGPLLFVGMGLGIAAVGVGVVAYSRRDAAGWSRLAGAGAICLGLIALLLAGARYGLILTAVERLQQIL